MFSRVFWQLGYPDRALEAARQIIQAPLADDDPITSCLGLISSSSVFDWSGDWTTVEAQAERLIAHATAHFLVPYRNVGLGLRAVVQIQRGQLEEGISLLRRSIASLDTNGYRLSTPTLCGTLAIGLAAAGHVEEALSGIDEIIASIETTGGLWILPELLRIKGELHTAMTDERQAQSSFQRAMALAREQSALSWQLRIAMSLCRLAKPDSGGDARTLLAEAYGRFTEGFTTADLKAARDLLGKAASERR
jgi:predicted ATPase